MNRVNCSNKLKYVYYIQLSQIFKGLYIIVYIQHVLIIIVIQITTLNLLNTFQFNFCVGAIAHYARIYVADRYMLC